MANARAKARYRVPQLSAASDALPRPIAPSFVPDPAALNAAFPQSQRVNEPAAELPDSSGGAQGFMDNLAMVLSQQQFQRPNPYHSQGNQFLEALIPALAQGFAIPRLRDAQGREQFNERARKAASDLATHRWEQTKQDVNNAADFRRGVTIARIGQEGMNTRQLAGFDARLQQIERAGEEARLTRQTAPATPFGAGGAGGAGNDTAKGLAQRVINGEMQITAIPARTGMRDAVLAEIVSGGEAIMPQKARDTISAINAAKVIVNKLSEANASIPRGEGMGRFVSGVGNVASLVTQQGPSARYAKDAKGMLSNLSRAMGERGVLTNQDIERVRALVPNLWDSGSFSAQQLDDLNSFLDELTNRTVTTYTKPQAGIGAQAAPANSAPAKVGVIRFVTGPDGKPMRAP